MRVRRLWSLKRPKFQRISCRFELWLSTSITRSKKLGSDTNESPTRRLRVTIVGLLSGRDLKRRNSTIVVGSGFPSSASWGSVLVLFWVESYAQASLSGTTSLSTHSKSTKRTYPSSSPLSYRESKLRWPFRISRPPP